MMKLILSLTLIWMLSSTDGALQCYDTIHGVTDCEPDQYCAISARRDAEQTYMPKGCKSRCPLGNYTFSFSFFGNMTVTRHCCNTSLCNDKDLPYPDVQKLNDLQCFGCEHEESDVCNKKVQCLGIQDRCISGFAGEDDDSKKFAGCASSNVCEPVNAMGIHFAKGTTCCGSSFCNSAWTVKLNVVLLLLGLILFAAC